MNDAASANNELVYSRAATALVMQEILCLFVGRGRKFSVVELSAASGVAERQIECAKRAPGDIEHRHLKFEEAASILSVIGVPAQNMFLERMGTKAQPRDQVEHAPGTVMAILSTGTAEFVKRGIDGIYCRRDRGELRETADKMIETLTPFSSKAG